MQQSWYPEEKFMVRAIEIARLGMGNVAPNPMVGCVITHNGRVIGEGYHCQFGKPHAEVNAINNVKDKSLLSSSTIYVTIEPCSHFGKTPPCSDLIIKHNISKVVIGNKDPFEKVAGKGIEKLINHGCEVIVGFLAEKCRELNRRFFTFHELKRPYIILKWAQTADGFIDIDRKSELFGQPTWITNDLARIAVHKMRADESAIMVGTNTALKDNPSLTIRDWSGHQPLRIVIDRELKLPQTLSLYDQRIPTLVYTSKEADTIGTIQFTKIVFDGSELESIMTDLYEKSVQSLIVEGGQLLLNSFIDNGLWDEARVFTGNVIFQKGIRAPKIDALHVKTDELDESRIYLFNRN